MKPDWKDAPEWAQWLCQQADNSWEWHAEEPFYMPSLGVWVNRGPRKVAVNGVGESLEKRPEASDEA